MRERNDESGKGVFVSEINCPGCLGEMLWSGKRSRWECACGKTIAVTVLVSHETEARNQGPQFAHGTAPVSVSASLTEMRRFPDSHSLVALPRTRQSIH